jgi:hypothetical protein
MPCPLNAVLISDAKKSLNFHKSCTLPDSLEMGIHMCTLVAFRVEGKLFTLPDLTVRCPQVVFRILLYNEMLVSLDPDFKRIILGGKPQK